MNPLRVVNIFGTVSVMLILSACYTLTPTQSPSELLIVTPAQASLLCEACDPATLASALTQEKNYADNQAASTAEIMRANAQATLNSAGSTQNAAI